MLIRMNSSNSQNQNLKDIHHTYKHDNSSKHNQNKQKLNGRIARARALWSEVLSRLFEGEADASGGPLRPGARSARHGQRGVGFIHAGWGRDWCSHIHEAYV